MKKDIERIGLYEGALLLVTSNIVKESTELALALPEETDLCEFYLDVVLDIEGINIEKILNIKIVKIAESLPYHFTTTAYLSTHKEDIPVLKINTDAEQMKMTNCFNFETTERFLNDFSYDNVKIRERNKFLFTIADNLTKELICV